MKPKYSYFHTHYVTPGKLEQSSYEKLFENIKYWIPSEIDVFVRRLQEGGSAL
jgi:hypothetical protein